MDSASIAPALELGPGTGPDWSFQDEAIADVMAALADGERVLLQSGTGTGKTIMLRGVIRRYLDNGGSTVMVIAHRREIITQTSAKLHAAGISHGVIQAGLEHLARPMARVQVCAIATLFVRAIKGKSMPLPPRGMLVIDECHHAVAPTYRKVINAYPDAMVLGVTATPCRGDGRGLGGIFSSMISTGTTKQMIRRNVLAKPVVFAPEDMKPD